MHTLIFIGRSGAGKGTQVQLLIKKLKEKTGKDVLYVEPGQRFREFVKEDSCSASKAREIVAVGGLQPSFLSVWVWADMLVKHVTCNEHIVLDGTPRRISEAQILESALKFYGHEKPFVIYIDVSRSWAIDRLHGRGRSDDTSDSITARMNWYDSDAVEAVDYMKGNEYYNFITINGEQSIEQVHDDICKAIKI